MSITLNTCIWILLLLSIFSANIISGESDDQNNSTSKGSNVTIPVWFEKNMALATQGTGRWIADNSPNKSETEPIDAYGMEYEWGAGKKSLNFRLFAIKDNKETAAIWEYRTFWHPGEKKVLVYQWGNDGTLALGEVRPMDISQDKFEVDQTFFEPDGSSWKSRHESIEKKGHRETKSFVFKDGGWKESRTYIWRLTN